MWRKIPTTCLAMAVALGLGPGCKLTSARPPYPDDPLLVSKKPVEGKGDRFRAPLVVRTEPPIPSLPPSVLVAQSKADAPPVDVVPSKKEPAHHAVATTPPRGGSNMPVAALPTARRRVAGTYGHAPDQSWLQGILEKDASGRLTLRFAEDTAEAVWDGRVRLEDDPRFGGYQPGDVILVEGDVLEDRGAPSYRIRNVSLVKRGE